MKNKNRKIAKASLIFAFFLFVGIFVPETVGIDGMNGGFALSVLLLFLTIVSSVTALVFWRLAKAQDSLLASKNLLLAHWQYSPAEWQKYVEKEHLIDAKNKKTLFYIVSGFAVFLGILFPILDPKAGFTVTCAMFGLILLIAAVAFFSIKYSYKYNKKNLGEAYIAPNGVLLNNQMHSFRALGARFEGIAYCKESPPCLEFHYSTPNSYSRQINSVRVPIPENKKKQAQELLNIFNNLFSKP